MPAGWWNPIIVGALLGFGAAMGVTAFCGVSQFATTLIAWFHKQVERLRPPDDDPALVDELEKRKREEV